ncbi:MAG: hypothetical protein BWX80_01097 [Candidatus Hydrogenedentes bacterium ADurb.Bin101]|jgi:hypothetical protein|nr:MAG: hypothetical protein BWX80_01097 [Candidatus Hydrogenedentes bacterium ADurb.Bin101]
MFHRDSACAFNAIVNLVPKLTWFPNSYLGTGSLLKFYFLFSC